MPAERPYLGQGTRTPHSRGELFRRTLWAIIERTLFRWSPRPWHGFRARLLRLFGAKIPEPDRVVIFPSVTVLFPWKLVLHPHAVIGPRVDVYNLATVTLHRGATVSQNVHLCAGTHDYTRWSMPLIARPITIEPNAWLAADVFVGPGVTIGELCVVGARSVVVRDLPPHTVCTGHPCRPIKDRVAPVAE